MHQQERFRCTIMRGGTSKGIYIMRNELPQVPELRDRIILAIFGSPDIRQIDGLGGSDLLVNAFSRTDHRILNHAGQFSMNPAERHFCLFITSLMSLDRLSSTFRPAFREFRL